MNDFNYHKPESADEAAKLLSAGATALAGGMTLLPAIKQGLSAPSALADLSATKDMQGIREHDNRGLVIGAMTTHAEVAASELVRAKIPALAKLADGIGDPQVRHRGTIGGSLANNDPAADYPAGLLGLGGSVHTTKRTIDADEFFTGLFSTALDEDEVILHVHFNIPEKAIYMKFPQPASRYALVGLMLAKTTDGVRAAVTGAGDNGVFRAADIENALNKDFSEASLNSVKIKTDGLMSDMHGSAEYRANLINVLAKRALS